MRNVYIYKGGREFKRVTRTTAKKLYNMGKAVLLVPCNLNPDGLFVGLYDLRKKESETPFETAVNAFEYYNCTNTETGRYTAFYIPNRTIDAFTGGDVTSDTLHTLETYDDSYLEEV